MSRATTVEPHACGRSIAQTRAKANACACARESARGRAGDRQCANARTKSKSSRMTRANASASDTWETITSLASRLGMCDLGQGYPDFGENVTARRVARDALLGTTDDVRANQYSAVSGTSRLVRALERYYRRTGYDLRAGSIASKEECVVVTCSATEALYGALKAAIEKPGDEIVFVAPYFPWYFAITQDLGGKSVAVRSEAPNFAIDVEALRAAITPRTKLIVHCSPHNPSGHVATRAELEGIASVAEEFNLNVLADEVYERSVFGDREHVRLATIGNMRERTVTLGSASKLLNLTGFRVGWAVGPPALISPIKSSHALMSYCAPTPLQIGVAAALEEISDRAVAGRVSSDDNAQVMRENATALAAALRDVGLEVYPPDGGYFLVASCAPLGLTDMEFCLALAEHAKVAAVPMSVFYLESESASAPKSLVRFAVCKVRATIDESASRIRAHARELKR